MSHVFPVKLVATVITIAGGGSAGKDGPCAQIGAGLALAFAGLLSLEESASKRIGTTAEFHYVSSSSSH